MDWPAEEGWPPQIGGLVRDGGRSYRIASLLRKRDVTVIVALPVEGGVRRVNG